jgi:predicted Zn-dependent protease with MMP-like domain
MRRPRRLQLLPQRAGGGGPFAQSRNPEARSSKPEGTEGAVTREAFTVLVEEALREIPRRFRKAMRNVAVVVEEEPSHEILDEMEIDEGDTLFGLYQGTPLTQRGWGYGNNLPDRISIYQKPIEEACADEEEIRDCIAETVIHEFGHYFGMSEEEIEEIEEKFWRGESIEQA